jgi:hypothetical protein
MRRGVSKQSDDEDDEHSVFEPAPPRHGHILGGGPRKQRAVETEGFRTLHRRNAWTNDSGANDDAGKKSSLIEFRDEPELATRSPSPKPNNSRAREGSKAWLNQHARGDSSDEDGEEQLFKPAASQLIGLKKSSQQPPRNAPAEAPTHAQAPATAAQEPSGQATQRSDHAAEGSSPPGASKWQARFNARLNRRGARADDSQDGRGDDAQQDKDSHIRIVYGNTREPDDHEVHFTVRPASPLDTVYGAGGSKRPPRNRAVLRDSMEEAQVQYQQPPISRAATPKQYGGQQRPSSSSSSSSTILPPMGRPGTQLASQPNGKDRPPRPAAVWLPSSHDVEPPEPYVDGRYPGAPGVSWPLEVPGISPPLSEPLFSTRGPSPRHQRLRSPMIVDGRVVSASQSPVDDIPSNQAAANVSAAIAPKPPRRSRPPSPSYAAALPPRMVVVGGRDDEGYEGTHPRRASGVIVQHARYLEEDDDKDATAMDSRQRPAELRTSPDRSSKLPNIKDKSVPVPHEELWDDGDRRRAASRIQAGIRAYRARKSYSHKLAKRAEKRAKRAAAAAIKLQASVRMSSRRRAYVVMRHSVRKQAMTTICRFAKSFVARRKWCRLRVKSAACTLQATAKRLLARRRYGWMVEDELRRQDEEKKRLEQKRREEEEERQRREEEKRREEQRRQEEERRQREEEEEKQRQEEERRRREVEEKQRQEERRRQEQLMRRRNAAALTIQCSYRCHRGRTRTRVLLEQLVRYNSGVLLSAAVRGACARAGYAFKLRSVHTLLSTGATKCARKWFLCLRGAAKIVQARAR